MNKNDQSMLLDLDKTFKRRLIKSELHQQLKNQIKINEEVKLLELL